MKISRIEVCKSPIKLKEPFVTSLGPLDVAENVLVVMRADNGMTGFGECSPFPAINGETMETGFVVGRNLARNLCGKDPCELEACAQAMDSVIYANSSIKSAFDMAVHDLAAQHAGLPLYSLLGGNKNKELVTDYTVSIGEPGKMKQAALNIRERGFQVIKVKLGESKAKDVERIRLIRDAVGPSIPIRIDANQGWQPAEAIEILKTLAPFQIQHCEEPIPRWLYSELPEVRKHSPIPIMADESCCDHHDAKRLIEIGACDLFNIKLGKSSGIVNARKIIQLAGQAGIKMQVGGFLESRLGFTASAHLALSSPHIIYCDFDTPLMFEEDPVTGGIHYGRGGVVTVPDTPGLGAAIDENYLEKLEKVVIL